MKNHFAGPSNQTVIDILRQRFWFLGWIKTYVASDSTQYLNPQLGYTWFPDFYLYINSYNFGKNISGILSSILLFSYIISLSGNFENYSFVTIL